MNVSDASSLLLLGVGGAGAAAVHGIARAFGPGLRMLAVDSDAATGADFPEGTFVLLGGNRLAGRGTGGQSASARAAVQDDPAFLDARLSGIRTAIIVTALGGGVGGGATPEILRHFARLGIVTCVFATLPFAFEGATRLAAARSAAGALAQHADAHVLLPLDDLAGGAEDMKGALAQAVSSLATAVTVFWRLLEKPGYLKLDAERVRGLLAGAGRARFACATAADGDRALKILQSLRASSLLVHAGEGPVIRTALLGVLAGDDLRLAEIGTLVEGVKAAFAPEADVALGTVNDESLFAGTLTAALLLFEESATPHTGATSAASAPRTARQPLNAAAQNAFRNADKTIWHGEDLDTPTFLRRNLTLDR